MSKPKFMPFTDEKFREEATEKSIESRKPGGKNENAGLKQAITKTMANAFFDCPSRTAYKNKHLNDATIDYIIKSMYDSKGSKQTNFVIDFIDAQLKEAKENPNSKAAERFSGILFNNELLAQMDEYLERSRDKDLEFYKYLVRSELYDKQQEVFDNNAYKKHLIINSRRSGKTFLMGRLIVKALLENPGAEVAYINRTSTAAIRQIKEPLEDALFKANLRIVKGSVESQELIVSNGGRVLIIGNNNASDVDRLRGESLALIILDEVGHQRNVRQLIREVVEPALMDYGKSARLYMVGTPPRNKGTYVEDVYEHAVERGWKIWHWTFMDNPFIPDRDSVVEEACKTNGVEKDSAFIRREYFGEMNAFDSDAMWIKKFEVDEEATVPKSNIKAYIGVDWGYEDKAAVVSLIASPSMGKGWIVDSWSESKTGIQKISEEVVRQYKYIRDNYGLEPMVICDSNEKGAVWDLYNAYHLHNVHLAYKAGLDYGYDQLAEFFATKRFIIKNDPSGRVREDCEKSMWMRDEETDVIKHELDDEIWHPNALMALMYISRQFAYDVLGWFDKNKAARSILEGKEPSYDPIDEPMNNFRVEYEGFEEQNKPLMRF